MAFGPSLGHAPLPMLSEVPQRIQLGAQNISILIVHTKYEGARSHVWMIPCCLTLGCISLSGLLSDLWSG